jgi:hypothetical protein
MKSKLFSAFDIDHDDNKQFKRDMGIVGKMSVDQLEAIAAALPALAAVKTVRERKPLYDKLSKTTGLSLAELARAIDLGVFFVRSIREDKEFGSDNPDAWVSDLLERGVVNQNDMGSVQRYLHLLKESVVPQVNEEQNRRRATARVFPSFKGSSTCVGLRAVLKDEYELGMPLEDFRPQVSAMTPIISVLITVDAGDDLAFQATPDELELLIGSLQSAVKSASAMEDFHSSPDRG